MKQLVAILLVSAFMLQSVSKLLIVANYQVNKEYIAKILCENKAKPKMHCNGKCHLKKQLEKDDKKDKSTPSSAKDKSEIQFYSGNIISFPIAEAKENSPLNTSYLLGNYNNHLSSVFHPPQA